MKICMNRPHAEYRTGDIYDLPIDIAERWVQRGLASLPGTPVACETVVTENGITGTVPVPDALAVARAVHIGFGKFKDKTVGDAEREDYAYLAKYLVVATDAAVMDAAIAIVGAHT